LKEDILKNFEFKNKEKYLKGHKKLDRYENYFHIAELLYQNGYLIHSTSLIFEAIGLYAKSAFKGYNEEIKQYLNDKENDSGLTLYDIADGCRSCLLYGSEKVRGIFDIKYNPHKNKVLYTSFQFKYITTINKKDNKIVAKLFTRINKYGDEIKHIKYTDEKYNLFREYIEDVRELRNNILHSNSGKRIENIKTEVKKAIKDFEYFCIGDENILGLKNGSK
jgi:hypothetical protein